MSTKLDFVRAGLIAQGVPAYGEFYGLSEDPTTAAGLQMQNWFSPDKWYDSIVTAEAGMTTGRNDTLLLTPEAHDLAAMLTWDLNFGHLCGLSGAGKQNKRTRISQSAAVAKLITVSGYGNVFANLYVMHGTTSATNKVGLYITGARNSFVNCHFLTQDATTLDQAAYYLVSINNSEQYFNGCTFGSDAVAMSAGSMLQLGATGDGGPPRAIFEDCTFVMMSDAAGVAFIDCALAGLGGGLAIFKNCHFINTGTSLTYGILGAGLSNFQLYFDNRCSFVGCDDIVVSTSENYVWCGGINLAINQVNTASSKLFNMLATHPDVS